MSKFSELSPVFDRALKALKPSLKRGALIESIPLAAQPFLAALIARSHPKDRLWMVCPDIRLQENFATELAAWWPGTRLFPEVEESAEENVLPDPESVSERLELLQALSTESFVGPLVLHAGQWAHEVPTGRTLGGAVLHLKKGGRLDLADAVHRLGESGYERAPQVATRGQFAIRGGIVDIYSWQSSLPLRIELDDDVIESIRDFHPDTQVSISLREECEILAGNLKKRLCPLAEYRRKDDLVIDLSEEPLVGSTRFSEEGEAGNVTVFAQPFSHFEAGDLVLDAVRRDHFFRQLEDWRSAGWMIVIGAGSEGEVERFQELATEEHFDASGVLFPFLPIARGFIIPSVKLAVLSDAELFGRNAAMRARRLAQRRERVLSGRAATDFTEFEPDDYVVHLEHGIGRFVGLEKADAMDGEETLVLEYAHEARLYVPLDQAWQIARYVGLGKKTPELSELGDGKWERAKQKAQRSIFDYATNMLSLQAERDIKPGHAFGPDTRWQQEFEDAFPYDETTDQLRAIVDAKEDMEGTRPMDRLICGDVGFGKTEVAIRAVFKAVMGGKQAAVLAPTTVLAQQHYENFKERMSEFPVKVELLSRYRTAGEQKRALKGLIEGSVDIVIGTHRLISGDVVFKDLGLVVVDEEQRFGVKHKDQLKERFRQIDVMTLSATPIPRTLYLSLMGARDMSLIETPPANRQSVETLICAYDERIFRDAIKRELARGGQVYFLHNRVKTIEKVARRIGELVPGARVLVGHGQMKEHELEPIMQSFVAGKADVLVSTTIIESGLDIPNANTIIIDRADLFGLADLYQLRGRVGRSQTKAYAYLMLPRDLMGAARKRVSAIKQYSELGSGFKIAMRDLEIRGAGNLLGTAQSGHIITVGFDLYCKLLKHAVDSLKGKKSRRRVPAGLRLDFLITDEAQWREAPEGKAGAFLPAAYVSDSQIRIACYRRLAEAETAESLTSLRDEWRDRFGPIPQVVDNALLCAELRLAAAERRISLIEVRDRKLMLTRRKELLQPGGKFPRLTSSDPDSSLREIFDHVRSVSTS